MNDKPGKPVGIQKQIGRRPIAAFDPDGDFETLEWTTSAPGLRLAMIVHQTDATREWAYDRGTPIGRLGRALDEAPKRGMTWPRSAKDNSPLRCEVRAMADMPVVTSKSPAARSTASFRREVLRPRVQ